MNVHSVGHAGSSGPGLAGHHGSVGVIGSMMKRPWAWMPWRAGSLVGDALIAMKYESPEFSSASPDLLDAALDKAEAVHERCRTEQRCRPAGQPHGRGSLRAGLFFPASP